MSTFTAAIDGLIQSSGSSDNMEKDYKRPLYRYNSYTPASVTARSPSPTSFSPSPYVVNYKGRRRYHQIDLPPDKGSTSKFRDPGPSEQTVRPVVPLTQTKNEDRNGFYTDDVVGKSLNDKQVLVAEGKLPMEQTRPTPLLVSRKPSPSLASSGYGEEFFDATESPFEGGDETSSQNEYNAEEVVTSEGGVEAKDEQEIERFKKAEEALEIVLHKLAAGGLALPETLLTNGPVPVEEVEDLDIAGQLLIKRMVEAAVARGAARAEIEEHLEAELENKNWEIEEKNREVTRLRDKVRYNELVNREMCQRNQEAIEMARNKRRARQKKIKWAVGSASALVVVGLSVALVYKYVDIPRIWKPKAEDAIRGTHEQ